jgi:hypothetical protein
MIYLPVKCHNIYFKLNINNFLILQNDFNSFPVTQGPQSIINLPQGPQSIINLHHYVLFPNTTIKTCRNITQ